VQIRDRIKQLRRVRAGDLIPHAKNWRTHPDAQRDALRGVLAEVGYADALLVRELPGGELQIIDGHLRAETTPESQVPVLVLDINEAEAEKILLIHDPLAAMATADQQQIGDLLQTCDFENEHVAEMLAELLRESEQADQLVDNPQNAVEVEIPELFQVVVECGGEQEQQSLYERMRKEGFKCRVLTL